MKTLLKHLTSLNLSAIPKDQLSEIFDHLYQTYPSHDPWGLNLEHAKKTLKTLYPLYRDYFKVRVFGTEHVEDRPYIVTSNHSGQIAIDGMLISTAFATEIKPPRILRAMVERFFVSLPFIGTLAAEGGAVLGDRQNCLNLLKQKQSVLVFPEGVRGIAKDTKDFYKLQPFTRGFFRISLASNIPILPVVVIGAEEFFPYVFHPMKLARALGLPALPISLNYLPLPSPVDIYILPPYPVPEGLSAESPDKQIDEHIFNLEKMMSAQIEIGLKNRRPFIASKTNKRVSSK
jgi:1-acyl-sn-glycerol-3-phosphate acyltransferase